MKMTNCRSAYMTRSIVVARIFDWEGTKIQVMTFSEIFKIETFCGTKMFYIGRSEVVDCVFARNQAFAIRRGLKSKIKTAKV